MKSLYKAFIVVSTAVVMGLSINSCTDPFKVGNNFLEKAPGGTVTADTVFTNAEYTRQFLANLYNKQYYALPTNSTNSPPQCRNYWKGMPDALSDTHQLFFTNTIVGNMYYTGALTSQTDGNNNGNIFPFLNEYVWEQIHNCYIFLDKIASVPGLDDAEKKRMTDEAKCIIASTYLTTFRFYGGLPLVKGSFTGAEDKYEYPRASVEETVNFIVGILDEIIANNNLPWAYTGAQAATETGRWTLAAAMALKIKTLQFAASPLFNDTKPYYDGEFTMKDSGPVWYGNYDAARWEKVKVACEAFFAKMNASDTYHLIVPEGKTQEDYRYAYRASYLLQNSPEVLMGIRVAKSANGNDYGWFNLRSNARFSYCPTQEYVEMFPWADGTPFNWEETEKAGKLDEMFIKGERVADKQMLQNRVYTRDPRLYENVAVNGALKTIDWGSGKTSGANYETWIGGTDALNNPVTQANHYGTGYRFLKYYAGDAYQRKFPHWVWLSVPEVYLAYAEALTQLGDNVKAIEYVDAVRARVGLKGLDECNPSLNLKTDKKNLIEEILRERACEFAFQDSRYFDLIRYKRKDLFEKKLHSLHIFRLVQNDKGEWVRENSQWYNGDRTKHEYKADGTTNPRYYEPSHFEYEKAPITGGARYWWDKGFSSKWYLNPFPIVEINKGYGLVQNPGW